MVARYSGGHGIRFFFNLLNNHPLYSDQFPLDTLKYEFASDNQKYLSLHVDSSFQSL